MLVSIIQGLNNKQEMSMSDWIDKKDLIKVIAKLDKSLTSQDAIVSRISEEHKGEENTTYNYYAGRTLGYFEGSANTLDRVLFMLQEVCKDE